VYVSGSRGPVGSALAFNEAFDLISSCYHGGVEFAAKSRRNATVLDAEEMQKLFGDLNLDDSDDEEES